MLRIEARYQGAEPATLSLTLPFDLRQKSRLRAVLDDGQEVAIQLERGTQLNHGELLQTTCSQVVLVRGAKEALSEVRSADAFVLMRAAYHLGNRHVALQIATGRLLYQHDHVLDAMLRQLGLDVALVEEPFEPETGAYGAGHAHAVRHSHAHGHSHSHSDSHGHSHSPAPHSRSRVHAGSPIVGTSVGREAAVSGKRKPSTGTSES